jgi:hypothetical protein
VPFSKKVPRFEKKALGFVDNGVRMHNYPKECIKPASPATGATISATSGATSFRKNHPDSQRVKCRV